MYIYIYITPLFYLPGGSLLSMRQAIDADGSGTLHVTELVQALRQRHVMIIGVYLGPCSKQNGYVIGAIGV